MWILSIQAVAYYGKVIIHPTPVASWELFIEPMTIGPVPGFAVFAAGLLFHGAWISLAFYTYAADRRKHRAREGQSAMG